MTTALWKGLILYLKRRGPRAFIKAHGALCIEGVAKPCIGINDHRQSSSVCNQCHCIGHFAGGAQANIRTAKAGIRHGRAAEIERFKPCVFSQRRRETVIDPWRNKDFLLLKSCFECHAAPPIQSSARAESI